MSIPIKKHSKLTAKYLLISILVFCTLSVISLLAYRAYLQHKLLEETRITAPNGIDSLEKVILGGVGHMLVDGVAVIQNGKPTKARPADFFTGKTSLIITFLFAFNSASFCDTIYGDLSMQDE